MPDKEKLLEMYYLMQCTRKFEEAILVLFEENKIRGAIHLGIGQEASTGGVAALREEDWIIPSHRGHGQSLAKGTPAKFVMAELLGKKTGVCKGRGGTVHISDMSRRNLGVCAIIGGSFCNAVGVGMAIKMDKKDDIILVYFGDGAVNEGNFHESLNMASIWKLPVVFLCENNGFALTVPFEYATAGKDVSKRAVAYDMPGVRIDGNDVLAVYDAVTEAAARARSGGGPTLIESVTYRWEGHWLGDPEVYRSREEVEHWKSKCPIKRFETMLLAENKASMEELNELEKRAENEIKEAVEFAESSPVADTATVTDDVFVDNAEGSGW